jgi:glutaminase
VTEESSRHRQRRARWLYNAPGAVPILIATGLLAVTASDAIARGPIGAREADYEMAVSQAHQRYQADPSGKVPENVAALAGTRPDAFGVVVVRSDGRVFEAGDTSLRFPQGAIAATFTAALALEQHGSDLMSSAKGAVAGTVPLPNARGAADWGLAPTAALELDGSLATLSLVQPSGDAAGKWTLILDNFGKFAGAPLSLDEHAYRAEKPLVARLPQAAQELATDGRLKDDPGITADLYLKQISVAATTRELAIMAATLANDGVNPVNEKRVVSAETAKKVQEMLLAKRKGQSAWMFKAGIAASVGNTGAIIVVLPGRLGVATYSPPLDSAGVSVRGQRAIKYLSQALLFNP